MDLLKVTPFYRFMAGQWGSKFKWIDNEESPITVDVCVRKTSDWEKLWVLDPRKELREHIRCVEILSRELYGMPFIYTIPSPIVQALHGISDPQQVYKDMKENPDALKEGLETITQTTLDFAKECIAQGVTGIFYGIGGGGDIWSRMTREQQSEYALYYDLKILKSIQEASIKILHICSAYGEDPQNNGGYMEEGWFKQFPVDAINWYDPSFTPLEKAKKIYGKKFGIVGGVDHRDLMQKGTPKQVEAAVKDALERTKQEGGFMIGPGCTLTTNVPLENYNAVARAVMKYGKYNK